MTEHEQGLLARVSEVQVVHTSREANALLRNGNWVLLATGVHPEAPGPVFIFGLVQEGRY